MNKTQQFYDTSKLVLVKVIQHEEKWDCFKREICKQRITQMNNGIKPETVFVLMDRKTMRNPATLYIIIY